MHSASLHPSSVCPSWFDKLIHVGCLTISRKRVFFEQCFPVFLVCEKGYNVFYWRFIQSWSNSLNTVPAGAGIIKQVFPGINLTK